MARCVVDDGWPLRQAAERLQVSPITAARWADRYRERGSAGMTDPSRRPRPHRAPPDSMHRSSAASRKTPLLRLRSGAESRQPAGHQTAAAGIPSRTHHLGLQKSGGSATITEHTPHSAATHPPAAPPTCLGRPASRSSHQAGRVSGQRERSGIAVSPMPPRPESGPVGTDRPPHRSPCRPLSADAQIAIVVRLARMQRLHGSQSFRYRETELRGHALGAPALNHL